MISVIFLKGNKTVLEREFLTKTEAEDFNGTDEGKFTMTFCSDNTISAYIEGQRFVFKPN